MKYKNYTKRNIFTPGVLTLLAEAVLSGVPTKEIKRLTTDEMCKIPEIYAQVECEPSASNILDCIDAEKVYKTGNGKEILGADIKAITSLMYLKPRTAYWKPERAQIYDSVVCGAVPLPMLGFKRWKGIPYSAWLRDILADDAPYIDEDHEITVIHLERIYDLDMLLGHTLASTKYNQDTDEIELTKGYGLVLAACYSDEYYRPNYNDIRNMRIHNMGNLKGSFANTYGTALISEEHDDVEVLPLMLHNRCTTPLRLMLTQRWVWYGNHRNADMIMDFQDWDNMPKCVDAVSTQMKGLEPLKDTNMGLKNRFGIGIPITSVATTTPKQEPIPLNGDTND